MLSDLSFGSTYPKQLRININTNLAIILPATKHNCKLNPQGATLYIICDADQVNT